MTLHKTAIDGCFEIVRDKISDPRGFFMRTFCETEFKKHHLETVFTQHSVSYNTKRYTLRGLHYQLSPFEEVKVVTCYAGEVFDVVVDLRVDSPSYRKWIAIHLSSEKLNSIYIPRGCAHGFQSLADHSILHYLISTNFNASAAAGIAWNDPTLAIQWPNKNLNEITISDKDLNWPNII